MRYAPLVAVDRLEAARLAGAAAVAMFAQYAVDAPGTYFGPSDQSTAAGNAFTGAIALLSAIGILARLSSWRWAVVPALATVCLSIAAFIPLLTADPVIAGSVVVWHLVVIGHVLFPTDPRVLHRIGGVARPPDDEVEMWLARNGAAARHFLSVSLLIAIAAIGYQVGDRVPAQMICGGLAVAALAISAPFLVRVWQRGARTPILAVLVLLAAVASFQRPELVLTLLALYQSIVLVLLVARTDVFDEILDAFYGRPALLLLISFLALIALGTLLLNLPAAAAPGHAISPIDALFTATSAVCVTGLIVRDTPHDFSNFGLAVILLLIQVGGLNIMVLSTFAALLAGQGLGLRGEGALGQMLGVEMPRRAHRVVVFIVLATLSIEGLGAVALSLSYGQEGFGPLSAIWHGVFHSISAFCNAGFSLHSDSLVRFQSRPWVVLVVAVLVTLGGLGFTVLAHAWGRLRGRHGSGAVFHVRLVVTTSAILVLVGALGYGVAEWDRSLSGLGVGDRMVNALFQSITCRTAGFNTVDVGSIRPFTMLLMIVLMFIGASPGGTGGGIKTTTAAILLGIVGAITRRREHIVLFRRRVQLETVYRSAAIAMIAALVVVGGCMLVFAVEEQPFQRLLFEVFSAFGTVGLTMGATPLLGLAGKMIIITVMLIGRIGPLSLALLLERRMAARISYPEARVMVG